MFEGQRGRTNLCPDGQVAIHKWLKNGFNMSKTICTVSHYTLGDRHGDPWLGPDSVSQECFLHVSHMLFLPPTTSPRLVLASGVTALSPTAESQHLDSPRTRAVTLCVKIIITFPQI